jgi:tetratricopeptide (TPR) repeat protein
VLTLLISVQIAAAEMPLPTYEDWMGRAKWHEVNAKLEENCQFSTLSSAVVCQDLPALEALIAETESFQKHVLRDAGLEYLIGLAWRYDGKEDRAGAKYRAAVALDPDYSAPWSDLGELHLIAGEYDKADEAFAQVTRLEADGPQGWIGPWRQAEVAAHQHNAEAFEDHMHEALKRGFSFRQIEGLPNWKGFYADPKMRDSIEKMITVYGSREILESLRP